MPDMLIDILVERLNGLMPRVAIVLGSGLGSLVEEVSDPIRVPSIRQAFR
jgi:purine-nucleoside phosphorylase